jgi:undecaprenyl-diphosphatase
MNLDFFLFQEINRFAGKYLWLDNLAIFFAEYFGYILVFFVLLIFWKNWKKILQTFLAAILARFGVVEIIRFFWQKPRPFVENNVNVLLNQINSVSFPSGHAAFYFGLSTIVYFYNKKVGILFFVLSFLISFSRVFCGIHWPSDIGAGILVGIFSGWLTIKIFRKF